MERFLSFIPSTEGRAAPAGRARRARAARTVTTAIAPTDTAANATPSGESGSLAPPKSPAGCASSSTPAKMRPKSSAKYLGTGSPSTTAQRRTITAGLE